MTLRIAMRLVPVALLAASAPAVLALGDDAAKAPAAAAAAPSTDPKPPYAAVVLKEDARVRAGPSANFRVLDKLAKGTLVTVTAIESEFARVRVPGGVPVFVHGDLLDIAADGSARVARTDVLMRPTAGQDYFPLEGQKLQKGDMVTVLEKGIGEKGAWVKVLPPDRVEVFLHTSLLLPAGADAAKDGGLDRVAKDRRAAFAGGRGAEGAKADEGTFREMVSAAAAALAAAAEGMLPDDAETHRENLARVMTESNESVLRGKAAQISADMVERERVVLYSRARNDRESVRQDLEKRLAKIEADYRVKMDAVLKAAPQNAPRWSAVGTVRRTYDGYELVKGEVRLHRIESLRYDLDELIDTRVGINGKQIPVDPVSGHAIFRVDSLEILE